MKNKVVIALSFLGLILASVHPAIGQTPAGTSPLVGSWRLTFTPTSSTVPPLVQIPGLATFTSDGTAIETDGASVAPVLVTAGSPAYGTPGHGIWQVGPAISNLFIQFYGLVVNADGTLKASRIVTITGAVDSTGTHLNAAYSSQLFDTAGHGLMTATGTLTGLKIPHPLLP